MNDLPHTLYLVAPINDQCNVDEDGVVSMDLFVWARDASEAVKLWREYYALDEEGTITESPLGVAERVRVFEVPVMAPGAPSTAIGWDNVHVYGATISERDQL